MYLLLILKLIHKANQLYLKKSAKSHLITDAGYFVCVCAIGLSPFYRQPEYINKAGITLQPTF